MGLGWGWFTGWSCWNSFVLCFLLTCNPSLYPGHPSLPQTSHLQEWDGLKSIFLSSCSLKPSSPVGQAYEQRCSFPTLADGDLKPGFSTSPMAEPLAVASAPHPFVTCWIWLALSNPFPLTGRIDKKVPPVMQSPSLLCNPPVSWWPPWYEPQ